MKNPLLILLFLASCSGNRTTHHYDSFLKDFNSDLVALGYKPIDFSETYIREEDDMKEANSPIVGRCPRVEAKRYGTTNILIDSKVARYGPDVQQAIIYHEIGHCFLGLDHIDSKKSIMTSQNLGSVLTFNDIFKDSQRRSLVKEMLEASNYNKEKTK